MSEEMKEPIPSEQETAGDMHEADACEAAEEDTSEDVEIASMEEPDAVEVTVLKPKKPIRISLTSFIFSAIALILATLMITYTCCSVYFKGEIAKAKQDQVVNGENDSFLNPTDADFYELSVLQSLFEAYSLTELNQAEIMPLVMKAYVAATGDRYAQYFTMEEYVSLMQSFSGSSKGIGVTVTSVKVTLDGKEQNVIRVEHVVKDSPAAAAGIQRGDLVVTVGVGEAAESVHDLGYEAAVNRLRGEEGTQAEFTVYRPNGDDYDKIPFSVTRAQITTESVLFEKLESDPTVGVVRILEFNLTTPVQFSEAIDTLKQQGCDRFVFDLRYNPGGMLISIRAVLSYFLNENDVILSTKTKAGDVEVIRALPVTDPDEEYASCNVTAEDIGKYKGLNAVVLCNGDTASAAELFVANFRDYNLSAIVGTKTFGKGSVQGYFGLMPYGINGVLKMTQQYYYPPCDEGYDGIGIAPNVEVSLSEEQEANFNIYIIEPDDQLTEALKHFH